MEFLELKEKILSDFNEKSPKDIIIDTNDLEYQYDNTSNRGLLLDVKKRYPALYLSEWAHQQFCTKISVPNPYIERCPPNLKENNCNHFLRNVKSTFKLRLTESNNIRAVLTETYTPIDDHELINLIEPFLKGNNISVISYYKSDRLTSIRGVFDEKERESLQVGDVVKKGVVINNSEVGYMAVQFRAFLYRLVCSNGLIAPKGLGGFHFRHRGDKMRLMESSQKAVQILDERTSQLLGLFERAKEKVIDKPIEFINEKSEEQHWPKKWAGQFVEAYQYEPTPSLYGVVNAYTRGAQTLSLHNRVAVEEFGVRLLESELQ